MNDSSRLPDEGKKEGDKPWWKHPATIVVCTLFLLTGVALIYYHWDVDPPEDSDLAFTLSAAESPDGANPADVLIGIAARIKPLLLPPLSKSVPPPGEDKPGERLTFATWNFDNESAIPWPAAIAQDYLDDHAVSLEEMRAVMSRPAREWDLGFRPEIDYELALSMETMHLPRLLAVDCLHTLHQGDSAAALETALLCIQFGNIFCQRAPSLIANLVASVWHDLGVRLCDHVLENGELSSEELKSMARRLRSLTPPDDWLIRALKSEYQLNKHALAHPEKWWHDASPDLPRPHDSLIDNLLFDENRTLRAAAEFWRAHIESVQDHRPFPENFKSDWEQELFLWKNRTGTKFMSQGRQVYPFVRDVLASYAHARAETLRIAVLAYRKEHDGTLPGTLEELAPGILPSLPTDPFSGENFGYDSKAGYLYSVGWDRVDAGGAPKSGGFKENLADPDNDDLTLGIVGATRARTP